MKDALQNSPSTWFRERRLAAGYQTHEALAQKLGVQRRKVSSWESNTQAPLWASIRAIAKAFNVTEAECISELWGEEVGDPCPCGCGGSRVLPRSENARCLGVELPCAMCGPEAIRFHPQRGRGHHRKLCPSCWNKCERVRRIPFNCIGYDDHSVKKLHANKCLDGKRMLPSEISNYPKQEDRSSGWQKAFFNKITETGRCARCASASLGLYQIENKINDSYVTDELIASRKQRKKVLAQVTASRKQYSSDVPDVFPNLIRFKPGQNWHGDPNSFKSRRTRVTEVGKLNRVKGRLYREWGGKTLPEEKPLPKEKVGRCLSCGHIVIVRSARPALFHGKCYSAWQHTPEGKLYSRNLALHRIGAVDKKPKLPKPSGERRPLKDPKLYFAWSVQHYLGKITLETIANTYHYTARSGEQRPYDIAFVQRAISKVISLLPERELLQKQFRLTVTLLRKESSTAA